MDKKYLGDGAYVQYDGYSYILTTEDGISTQNIIVLDPDYMDELLRYVEKIKKQHKEGRMP